MNHDCQCSAGHANQPKLISLNARNLSDLSTLANQRLVDASRALAAARSNPRNAASAPDNHFHLTEAGDALATTSFAEGLGGDTVVRGTIAGLPYELHISVALEGSQVSVTLHLTKPIELGPYTWRFDLGGIVRGANSEIVGASSLALAADSQMMGIGWWCAVKCGGLTLLPTLIACLPALSGGPAAYVACVIGKLGAGGAASIALCIAKSCV